MTASIVPGSVIGERYRLERLLGEGGMGAVWAATHVITRKRVALKFLKGATSGNANLIKRFLREARAASAAQHPNVVAVHDILQLEDGSPVMVMDLLNGESLAEHLARVRMMPLPELAEVLAPALSAVGTAHSVGIVHRDLKPDNIFLHQRGDGGMEPKVLDFGIAKLSAKEGEAAETAHLTQTGAVLGTPYYMSPEQVFGERDIDQRADIWSLGVILYECLAGRRPIDGDNFGQLFKAITTGSITPLEQVAPQLPADITRLVGRMLQVDRAQRPEDLREPHEILSRYASNKAASFGGAAPLLRTEPPPPDDTGSPGSRGSEVSMAFEETAAAVSDMPGAALSSAGAFSRTSNDEAPKRSRRGPRVALAVGGALVIAAALGGWKILGAAPASSSAEPAVASIGPVAASASEVPAAASQRPVPVEPTTANAAPSASAVPERHVVIAKRVVHNAAPAAPVTPASSAKPEPSTPAKLPGNVVGTAPF